MNGKIQNMQVFQLFECGKLNQNADKCKIDFSERSDRTTRTSEAIELSLSSIKHPAWRNKALKERRLVSRMSRTSEAIERFEQAKRSNISLSSIKPLSF